MSIKVGDKDLFPYLGDYRPVNIYKGEHKVAGWKWAEQGGQEVSFENTYNDFVHVEVDGKSYQGGEPSPENPIEIHSLNDFDVVSSVGGRNLLRDSGEEVSNGSYKIAGYDLTDEIKENEEVTLTIWGELASTKSNFRAYNSGGTVRVATLTDNGDGTYSSTFKWEIGTSNNTHLNVYVSTKAQTGISTINKIKLEKGNIATDWTPAPEDIAESDNHPLIDKINLSLSEPLRSVGDVKDRLFRDSDGLWKVERNVGERVLKGTTGWSADGLRYQGYNYAYFRPVNFKTNGVVRSNILPYGNFTDNTRETLGRTSVIVFNLRDSRSGVSSSDSGSQIANKIRDYLFSIEGAMVSYELSTPAIETLDQELQDKLNNLRSFQGSNYIYTMVENLKPTLHARLKVKDI